MTIGEYVKEYTSGERVEFREVLAEERELIVEIFKLNQAGIKEEFGDVFHFLQLWLFWRFGIDEEIWKITKDSVKKFMDRKSVWNEIYIYVGLKNNISGFVGNYKKVHKVINHLQKFGINKKKAEEAYGKIVLKI
jgi:hypothetical protein